MSADIGSFQYSKNSRQFFIYFLLGVLTNVSIYFLYLLITYLWGAPKLTMTALYFVGASIGFLANRRFTFEHDGDITVTGVRYSLAQVAGYLLNLVLLLLFSDWLDFPHQIVQATAFVVVAVFLFAVMRSFVFTPNSEATGLVR